MTTTYDTRINDGDSTIRAVANMIRHDEQVCSDVFSRPAVLMDAAAGSESRR